MPKTNDEKLAALSMALFLSLGGTAGTLRAQEANCSYGWQGQDPRTIGIQFTPEQKQIVHPVLKVKMDEHIKRLIPKTSFKEFAAMAKPIYRKRYGISEPPFLWSVGFGIPESDAVIQIKRRVIGLSKAEVLELLGPPDYSGDPLPEWSGVAKSGEVMLYEFGGNRLPLLLLFPFKNCRKAVYLDEDQMDAYRLKAATEMLAFCVGKAVARVIDKFGQADEFQCLDRDGKTVTGKMTYTLGHFSKVVFEVRDDKVIHGAFLDSDKVELKVGAD